MDQLGYAQSSLASGKEALLAMLRSFDEEAARWRPEPGKWSALEIANHLADEEREDFRARLGSTLEDPAAVWQPIDPEGWVTGRGYGQRAFASSIDRFSSERDASLLWLDQLEAPDWNFTHAASDSIRLRAGDLLVSWVAHDLFHVRQLVRLRYRYLAQVFPEYDPGYAGDWGEV